MENPALFHVFLVAWCVGVLAMHVWGWRKRVSQMGIAAAHSGSTVVAALMTFVFVIGGGATTVQFVAESSAGIDLWMMWGDLWPLLLLLSGLSAAINVVCLIIFCSSASERRWVPVTAAGSVLSVLAFFAVGSNFPSA